MAISRVPPAASAPSAVNTESSRLHQSLRAATRRWGPGCLPRDWLQDVVYCDTLITLRNKHLPALTRVRTNLAGSSFLSDSLTVFDICGDRQHRRMPGYAFLLSLIIATVDMIDTIIISITNVPDRQQNSLPAPGSVRDFVSRIGRECARYAAAGERLRLGKSAANIRTLWRCPLFSGFGSRAISCPFAGLRIDFYCSPLTPTHINAKATALGGGCFVTSFLWGALPFWQMNGSRNGSGLIPPSQFGSGPLKAGEVVR